MHSNACAVLADGMGPNWKLVVTQYAVHLTTLPDYLTPGHLTSLPPYHLTTFPAYYLTPLYLSTLLHLLPH